MKTPGRSSMIALAAVTAAVAAAAIPAPATAQLINLKTVPVAAGDQFLIHPSQNLGMGGISIALDDPLLDPFVNPAKGSRIEGSRLLGSPTFYSISENDGSGRTLPVAGLLGGRRWFGGTSLSLQQIEAADRDVTFFGGPVQQQTLREQTATNTYAFVMGGRKVGDGNGAVAASFSYADLNAVDGVDLLYALSQSVEQSGRIVDYRIGYYDRNPDGRDFEVLLLHNRFDVTHNVTYLDWFWTGNPSQPELRERLEHNPDRTNTWGVHLGYARPIADNGWRVGGILTGNWKSHPKIPNYEIMNIPRDPGDSYAYNIGIGIARQDGPVVFGVDLIYEPIWSNTWAEAADTVRTASGLLLERGERTVENDFRFSNAHMRMGVARETETYGLQLGLQLYSVSYDLEQDDRVTEIRRDQKESWMEWIPSWGGSLKFPELEIRYLGRFTTGTGRPGVAWTGARGAMLEAALASDFIVAPSGPLTLQDAHVLTHQLSVSLPLR